MRTACKVRLLLIFLAAGAVFPPALARPVESELLVGSFVSPLWNRGSRRTFNYTGLFFREAWPLHWAGRNPAQWQWVGELFVAGVTSGFGHNLAGPSLLIRRWFGPAAARLRVYVQAGFGALYTDAYRSPYQDQLGEALQFKSTAGVGFQARLWRAWSWAGELSFNHISDGGLSNRNYGVRSLGLALGLARSF